MIKFDTKTCMVIVSKDEIKYETRVSNFIAFGSPWPIQSKIVSEYDQEIPQSQTADNPVAPRGRATQPSRDTKKTN